MKNYLPSILRNRWMLVPIIILLLFGGLRTACGLWMKNAKGEYLKSFCNFDVEISQNSPYASGTTMADIPRALRTMPYDMPEAWGYETAVYLVPTFKLPVTLKYYRALGDVEPAYVLKKGTTVVLQCSFDYINEYREAQFPDYGFDSLPTYKAGWRYTRPFVVAEAESDMPIRSSTDTRIADLPYYYIRFADLFACKAGYWPLAAKAAAPHGTHWFRYLADTFCRSPYQMWVGTLLNEDITLCREKIYVSEELRNIPFYDGWNIVFLSAAGVLLTLHIVLRVRKAKN